MLSKVETKNKAIDLRRLGLSYSEILAKLPSTVSKSTLSNWFSSIELTIEQKEILKVRMSKGRDISRFNAILAHNQKRLARENDVNQKAVEEFKTHKSENLFLIGIALYWAEGGKKNRYFQFMNSDPEMIILMIKWLEKFLKIPRNLIKYRLFIHQPYKNENCEEFWASKIGVSPSVFQKTIYKPTPHTVKKNQDYKGCFRLSITKIDIYYRLMYWQKLLIGYYKD